MDEKARSVIVTEEGVAHAEKLVNLPNLYDPRNIEVLHHLNAALKAHNLFKRDVDYIVKEGQVLIVDEFTGRLMPGRRYSDGLHQALEAKEGVKIENENQTLATITFQNFFRMYDKLAGMTGTADTEAEEFKKIYNLEVMIIPTDQKMIRTDYPDAIYRTEAEKYTAVVADIKDCHQRGQPVLVGTTSIEKSEHVSRLLKKEGIKHEVLNAKQHEKEAQIVAHAGQMGMVTIATNMAGRGTDIVLGEGVVERAASTSWPPSATSPAASTTSSGAAPAARAIPAPPGSISPWRTTCCASSAPTASRASWAAWGWTTANPSSTAWCPMPSKRPRSGWKATTSISANTSWNTTTS